MRRPVTLAAVHRTRLSSAHLTVDGRPQNLENLLAYAGAFQLTLSSAVPDLGAQLHSSYLGHPDADLTAASHLWLAVGPPRVWLVERDPATLPVMHARRLCLLDHLSVLADQLRPRAEVTVDVPSDALDEVDDA